MGGGGVSCKQKSVQAAALGVPLLSLPVDRLVPQQTAQRHDDSANETEHGEDGHVRMRDDPPLGSDERGVERLYAPLEHGLRVFWTGGACEDCLERRCDAHRVERDRMSRAVLVIVQQALQPRPSATLSAI